VREHPEVAREYEELKRGLAPLHSATTFGSRAGAVVGPDGTSRRT
jgi:hypothetical protein